MMDERTPTERSIEAMCNYAELLYAYYLALIGAGFSDENAMLLTTRLQHDMVLGAAAK